MKESEDVSRLISLKRYETPGEDYYARFASEFKDRQRAELLQRSSVGLFAERIQLWSQQFGAARWAIPATAAAALVGGALVVNSVWDRNPAAVETVAGGQDTSETFELPPFPEAPEESIELTLPRTSGAPSSIPGRSATGPILPTGGTLVEL